MKFKKDFEPFILGDKLDFKQVNLLVGDQGAGKSTLIHLLNNAKNKTLIQNKVDELMSPDENVAKSANKVFNAAFLQDKGMLETDDKGKITNLEAGGLFDEYDTVFDIEHNPEFHLNLRFLDTEAHNPRIKYAEYDSKRPILQELSMICRNIHRAVQNEKDKVRVRAIFNAYYKEANAPKKDLDGMVINSHRSHGETILPMLRELVKIKNHVILLDEPETSLSIRSQYKFANIIQKLVANGNQLFIATHSPIIMGFHGEVLSLEHKKWMSSDEFLLTQQ